ncbi:murein L,D-transpeptidase catalytic domain family protein [Chitinophagaceae bacterium MMS25-I14]
MNKKILCLLVCLLTISPRFSAIASEPAVVMSEQRVASYIDNLYKQIRFDANGILDHDVFEKAMRGYINLSNAGKLNNQKHTLTVCDLTKSANQYRIWVIDLDSKNVLFHTYVAHGQGSGEEFATAFSNRNESHQTSLGFYVTGETYDGEHGTSLKLYGMDRGFNSAAYDRGIVVHGAEYVCKQFINDNSHLGRSWGCPAVPSSLSLKIINAIKDGTCLFMYYPQKSYLKTAYWLNKKLDRLPEDNNFELMPFAQNTAPLQKLPVITEMPSPQPVAANAAPVHTDSVKHVNNVDPGAILLN